jgi:hypothetical protein
MERKRLPNSRRGNPKWPCRPSCDVKALDRIAKQQWIAQRVRRHDKSAKAIERLIDPCVCRDQIGTRWRSPPNVDPCISVCCESRYPDSESHICISEGILPWNSGKCGITELLGINSRIRPCLDFQWIHGRKIESNHRGLDLRD